jgi:hypothetical protein
MSTNSRVFDVLARAADETEIVTVELRDGQRFRDGVCEVFSACGARYVIFHAHNRMNVDDITRCASAPAVVDAIP